MIDLIFKNGQAPALNADNMNKIVNGINQNEAKSKDLQSEIATLVIEKGGSIVQANPEEVPTEKMKAIRINNDVFEVASETGIDMTYEDYMALVEADQDAPDTNYFVTGAPTSSGSVASEFENVYSEIDDLKTSLNNIKWEDVNITYTTDFSKMSGYIKKLLNIVSVSLEVRGTVTANTWATIGTLAIKPKSEVKGVAIRTGNGTYTGMVSAMTDGTIRIYSTQTFSNGGFSFDLSYETV